jgi:hypothetical protein
MSILVVAFFLVMCGDDRSTGDGGKGGEAGNPAGADSGGSSSGGRGGTTGGSSSSGRGGATGGEAGSGEDGGADSGGSAGAGAGGLAGEGGDGGTGVVPDPTCDFGPIQSDFVRDWDLGPANVSGAVTLNGAPMPDSPEVMGRGAVSFREQATGMTYRYPLAAVGEASFSGLIFRGRYDVDFTTTDEVELVDALPRDKTARIARDLDVGEDGTFTFDARTLDVLGTIQVNGEDMPNSNLVTRRGSVVFRERRTASEYALSVGTSSSAKYSGLLFAGDYDIAFVTTAETALVGLPVNQTARLAQGVELVNDVTLDYDVHPETVSGTVSMGGGPMPDSAGVTSRGSVIFRSSRSGEEHPFTLAATGAATFSGLVFRDAYNVELRTTDDPDLVTLPINQAVELGRNVSVTGGASLDYDVRVVTVSGTISVDGGAMPDSPLTSRRGQVFFRDAATSSFSAVNVGPTGPGTYTARLFASTYEVVFKATPDMNVVGLPPNRRVVLGQRVSVEADATLSHDVRPIHVTGTLTANGDALGDSPSAVSRGNVIFRDLASAEKYSSPLSAAGPASFSTFLFAGAYGVTLSSPTDGLAGFPSGTIARIVQKTTLSSSGAVSYDMRSVAASGVVTDDGRELVASPDVLTRGNVIFRDRVTGHGYPFEVLPTGSANYAGLLHAGAYRVEFWSTSNVALLGLPIASAHGLGVSCLSTGDCQRDADDLTGLWDLTLQGYGELNVDLRHTGTTVTGIFNGDQEGAFTAGTVQDDSIELVAPSYGACRPFRVRAAIVDGCTIVGTATCSDQPFYIEAIGTR